MKQLTAGLILMIITTASYAKVYECIGYIDGAPVGKPLKVNATKTPIAEDKAYDRFLTKEKVKVKMDYVKCK